MKTKVNELIDNFYNIHRGIGIIEYELFTAEYFNLQKLIGCIDKTAVYETINDKLKEINIDNMELPIIDGNVFGDEAVKCLLIIKNYEYNKLYLK